MPEARFHYFTGDDEFLIDHAARECFERLSKDATGDFAREIIDGAAVKVDDAEAGIASFALAVGTISMFGDKKFVWLRGLNWLAGDSVLGKSEGGKACVEELVKVLETADPGGVAVVISAYPVNGVRREAKWLKEHGETRVIQTVDKKAFSQAGAAVPEAVAEMLEGECRAFRVKARSSVVQELFDKVGRNTRLAIEEVRKLATYLGPSGGEITSELIAKLVPPFGDGDFFEPVEAFYSGNLEWALEALRRFFFNEPNGSRGLLASMQKRNRLVLQVRTLMDSGALRAGSGVSKDALARAAVAYGGAFGEGITEKSELNVFAQHPFYLGKIAGGAARFTLRSLMDIQLALVEIFAALLSPATRDTPEILFRELFIRFLARAKAA